MGARPCIPVWAVVLTALAGRDEDEDEGSKYDERRTTKQTN